MSQTLKEVTIELKKIVFEKYEIDVEKYIIDLSEKSNLGFDDLKELYNAISLWRYNEEDEETVSKKKVWSTGEDQLVHSYIEIGLNEIDNKGRNKTKSRLITELADIITDRTRASINFRYYNNINISNEEDSDEEPVTKEQPIIEQSPITVKELDSNQDNDNLLDMVIDFVDNVDSVGVNINDLFKGLLAISQKAVENSNVEKVEHLEGEVDFFKSELEKEKTKNEELQREFGKLYSEFDKLRREVEYFDGLSGKQKLQQLHNYNKKMRYMLDKFGGVISVGYDENVG